MMNKIRHLTKCFLLFIGVTLFAPSCKKNNPVPSKPVEPEKPTIAEVTSSVNTALAGKDTLSQFATMFKTAGLTQAEVDAGITVFAPSNKAYTLKTSSIKTTAAGADVYLPDSSVVKDYIVSGKIDISKIASSTTLTSLSGKNLVLSKAGEKWLLNDVFLNTTVLSTGNNSVVFTLAGLLNASKLPRITGVSDVKTFPGWLLTIYGDNFGLTADKNVVKVDGITATVHSASTDSLLITVPQGVQAGIITIDTKGRTIAAPQNLTVQKANVTTIAGTSGGAVQGITIDAADNLYWTDNVYNGNNANARLVKYSTGQFSSYRPTFPNPNRDGKDIPVFDTKATLWAIAVNNQNQVYFVTQNSGNTGYSGIFRGTTIPTTADWWAGGGLDFTAITKNSLKVVATAAAFDKQGNLFIFNNENLQKITPAGAVSIDINIVAFRSADPHVQTVSSYGIVLAGSTTYVSDAANGRIWMKDNNGLKVIAGNNTHVAKDGLGTAAQFGKPFGMAVDKKGNLYVCDNDYTNSKFIIRMINPRGVVTTIAGGASGEKDGIGVASGFQGVNSVAIDSKGGLYIGTDVGTIRKISFQ